MLQLAIEELFRAGLLNYDDKCNDVMLQKNLNDIANICDSISGRAIKKLPLIAYSRSKNYKILGATVDVSRYVTMMIFFEFNIKKSKT